MIATGRQRTVRINEATHRMLSDLAEERGESMAEVLERAVDRFRRAQVLHNANAIWEAILKDPAARAEVEAEDALWDGTLADGLDAEEW